jgi:RHH-type proline utilization regulon transcriptional repressor/proline dehydrogenase/delta 1-pyrroline-5-carboxylate dehydrogenase
MWSPGVKTGVRPGSWFHLTECFGPVLGVMRADDLDAALALQNATEFGLTAGLHTLDPDEIEHWIEHVEAGNVYVNRHTTGAIVRRQPFGGWKHSSVGPGAKTGGPHDILRFVRFHPSSLDTPLDASALEPRDLAGLRAEENMLRARPLHRVLVRAGATTSDAERGVLADAARITGVAYEVSDDDDTLARRAGAGGVDRLRTLAPISDVLARACHEAGVTIDDTAVTAASAVELSRWTREQAISRTMHRHGRLPRGR